MPRPSPVRLVIALSVAAVLAIFLLYVSVAGGTPSIQPSQLSGHKGNVALVGKVAFPVWTAYSAMYSWRTVPLVAISMYLKS